MDVILSRVQCHFALVLFYLDDIVIYSKSPKAHIKLVGHILMPPRISSILTKLKNYKFFSNAMNYLSHVILNNQRYLNTPSTQFATKNLNEYYVTSFFPALLQPLLSLFIQLHTNCGTAN